MMEHGADIYTYAKKIGCKPSQIIDFSSNINFNQPHIKVKNIDGLITRYGDSSYEDLKKVIARRYKIKTNKIALFNGATSAIFYLLQSLKNEKVYLYAPLYGEYEKSISKKAKIIKINRFEKSSVLPAKNSIVIFSNPSTPDGKYYDLQKLFKVWKKQECTIILDESFIEFENLKSYRDEIDNYEKLYIIQSFSKFYSCGGVRIGAIFSHKKNIKKLKTPLWHLSSFDVAFLTARLKDINFKIKSQKLHKQNKQQLKDILVRSKLFNEIFESDANFFLVKSKKGEKVFNYLLKHKILIRTCESFDYLDENYLRFAVKDQQSLQYLAKVFEVKLKWYERPKTFFQNLINRFKPSKKG